MDEAVVELELFKLYYVDRTDTLKLLDDDDGTIKRSKMRFPSTYISAFFPLVHSAYPCIGPEPIILHVCVCRL